MSEPLTGPQELVRPFEQVELLAEAVLAVPGVANLAGGQFGEYTTYLPGRRVAGVVERDGVLTVAVVVSPAEPLLLVADRVRSAVGAVSDDTIDVVIADLDVEL